VEDRNLVESIRGLKVFVKRQDFGELDEDEFFIQDLIGFRVFCNNIERGCILNIDNYGASDVILIKLNNETEVMLPYIEETVKEIDIEKKVICIENLDDYI
jgi:16S rRNA processing protein RimM